MNKITSFMLFFLFLSNGFLYADGSLSCYPFFVPGYPQCCYTPPCQGDSNSYGSCSNTSEFIDDSGCFPARFDMQNHAIQSVANALPLAPLHMLDVPVARKGVGNCGLAIPSSDVSFNSSVFHLVDNALFITRSGLGGSVLSSDSVMWAGLATDANGHYCGQLHHCYDIYQPWYPGRYAPTIVGGGEWVGFVGNFYYATNYPITVTSTDLCTGHTDSQTIKIMIYTQPHDWVPPCGPSCSTQNCDYRDCGGNSHCYARPDEYTQCVCDLDVESCPGHCSGVEWRSGSDLGCHCTSDVDVNILCDRSCPLFLLK